MSRFRRDRQSGQSLVSVIGLTSVVALLVIASLTWARSTTSQGARDVREDRALQAAEAGLQQYISRMVENPGYVSQYVDKAEDPRTATASGQVVGPGNAWPSGQTQWTYSGPPTTWMPLDDQRFGQASYSLRVNNENGLVVQSTARVMPSGGKNPVERSVQATIAPISISDFQMIANTSIAYGSAATTEGKLWSAGDISHAGTAKERLYAANYVCRTGGLPCYSSQANNSAFTKGAFDKATTPSFNDAAPQIDFTAFTQDMVNIKNAAQATGVYRNDGTAKAWMVQFLSSGSVRIWKITGNPNLETSVGTLQCPQTITMPGGAQPFYMYFEQPVVVGNGNSVTDSCSATSGSRASVVDGQVTLVSASNVYIGNDIDYETSGDDVLGLIAGGEMIMANYTPTNLNWRAATLAQNGQWRTAAGYSGNHGQLVFRGSTATSNGGYANMFNSRSYLYDTTLKSLRPPLFPTLEGDWDVSKWREVTPPS
ncbi:MAG: hypothetical protein R2878_11655 [Thermoleophilia bacterium]